MKKLLYSLSIVFSCYSFGQINLEKTIDDEVSVYSNNGETYYVSSGSDLKTVKIFIKNFNLYKEFNPNVPDNYIATKNSKYSNLENTIKMIDETIKTFENSKLKNNSEILEKFKDTKIKKYLI